MQETSSPPARMEGEQGVREVRRELKDALKREARLKRELEDARRELESAVADAERRKRKIAESVGRFREMIKIRQELEVALRRERKEREQLESKAAKVGRLLRKSREEIAQLEETMTGQEDRGQEDLSRQLRDKPASVSTMARRDGDEDGVSADPDVQSRLDEAAAHVRARQLDQAERVLQSGRRQWSSEPGFLVGLATLYYGRGDFEAAQSLADEALSLDRDLADAHAVRGMIAFHRNELVLASRALKKAVRLDPDDGHFRIYYGMVMHKRGLYEEALKQLENAVALDPMNSEAQFNMAVLLTGGEKPNLAQARARYEEALRLGSSPDPALERILNQR